MSVEGSSGYRPGDIYPDLTIDGQDMNALIKADLKREQMEKIRKAADASFTKKITSKITGNIGTGVGSSVGVLAWTGAGAVAGAIVTVAVDSMGPHLQPYIENAGGYLMWGVQEALPQPGTFIANLLEEAKPKPGTLGEQVAQFIIYDASPVVIDGIIGMAAKVKDTVVANLTSIGAVAGGLLSQDKSSHYADNLGRSVALPIVRARAGISRLSLLRRSRRF